MSFTGFLRGLPAGVKLLDRRELADYLRNVCAAEREVRAVVFPERKAQVQKLVQLAVQEKQPLYPLSQGKNWGLGSRLPVRGGHVVVDLSRMRRILELSDLGSIHIEAGTTQADVADRLKATDFVLSVTGSARESSLVGNALERGVAHYGCRAAEILGMHVILGTGQELATGCATLPGSARAAYPFGLGPDLRGLFFQSNYGIVTSAWVRLRPRRQVVAAVLMEKKPTTPLPTFVDALRGLHVRGLLNRNVHLSNRTRRTSVIAPLLARHHGEPLAQAAARLRLPEWSAIASLELERPLMEPHLELIRATLEPLANVSVRTSDDPPDPVSAGLFGHSCGEPCDDALPSLGFLQNESVGSEPARSQTGVLFLVPLIPFRGADVDQAVAIIEEEFRDFPPLITLNLLEDSGLEGVVNLTFDRREPAQVKAAYETMAAAFARLVDGGFPPQRMSIFQQELFRHPRSDHARAVRQLKRLFDPAGIIARGRYEF